MLCGEKNKGYLSLRLTIGAVTRFDNFVDLFFPSHFSLHLSLHLLSPWCFSVFRLVLLAIFFLSHLFMVITRSIREQSFKEEIARLAKIEFDSPAPSFCVNHSIVYRPLFLSIMEEQFMHNVAKEQIKTLTKFNGSPDEDIVKWVQDMDEVFDRAQLQSSNKFLAIQSYLAGAAMKWFRFNKAHIPDWSSFKYSIIKAYQPTLPQILTRMEHRHQLVGESVMEYYHDKIALCSQVDSEMSCSMLLHYLTKGNEEKIRFTLANLPSTSSIENDYLIDDIPVDPLVATVQRPGPQSTSSSVRPRFRSPPRPLMDLPTPSFTSLPHRHSYRPSLPSSSSRQCYQCHRFGHIALHCPTRKNV